MIRRRRLVLLLLFAVAGVGVLLPAGLYVIVAFDPGARFGIDAAVLTAGLLFGLGGLAAAAAVARLHFRQLERLRGAILTLAGDPEAVPPLHRADEAGAELANVWSALGELAGRYARMRTAPDARLQAVLGTITEAIVVITDNGQVSLVNAPAKALLGDERVRVGTSVFAALHRHPVVKAVRAAERAGTAVDATLPTVDDAPLTARVLPLGEHGGAVLSFGAQEAAAGDLEHALELHDRPPAPAGPVSPDSRLDDLAMVVLDTETTGLAVAAAHVVSVGAVRLHGSRIYRGVTLDRLVRPGIAIPAASTAVHGITDDMVADAPAFPEVFGLLREMIADTAVVGHNVMFDVAVLEQECRRHGLSWQRPPVLDTFLLAAALFPERENLELEALAAEFGVEIQGRHTALGDSLVTAQVFVRMLPLLIDAGAATLGQAQALAETRKDLVKLQRRSGW